MAPLRVCLLLFALFVSNEAAKYRGFIFKGLKEPEFIQPRVEVKERWVEQPVDHFNARDNRTWSMRYYENLEFFTGSGPIFIMIGGEWEISTAFLLTGQMFDIAEQHKGPMYYTEHRYYGKSKPVDDASVDNLQYLNVDQALADVAYFIEAKKREYPGLANSSVIVFGGSYAGNMAAWARIKYPHLIQGAIASSAPVRAKTDFFEYYEVVTRSLNRSSQQCADDIHTAFKEVTHLLSTDTGPETLKKIFHLCEVPNNSSTSNISLFISALTEEFAGIVQYNRMYPDNTSTISRLCDTMTDSSLGSPVMRLAEHMATTDCLSVVYDDFVTGFKNSTWDSQKYSSFMRIWFYQTCTEFGYYQTTSTNSSIFGTFVPVEFYTKICSDVYGTYFGSNLVNSKVKRTNIMYGGSLPDVKNVVFTNGNVDPWHALSVLEDLNEKSPAILIDGSSHCEDLQPESLFEVPGLSVARKRVQSIVASWINSR